MTTDTDDLWAAAATEISAKLGPGSKTLRDEFAMAALQGLAAHPTGPTRKGIETGAQAHARLSYQYADAMLLERVK